MGFQSTINQALGTIAHEEAVTGLLGKESLVSKTKEALDKAQQKAGTVPFKGKSKTITQIPKITPDVAEKTIDHETALANQAKMRGNMEQYKKHTERADFYRKVLESQKRDAMAKAKAKQTAQEQQKTELANRKNLLNPDAARTLAIMRGVNYTDPNEEEDKK